jgi:hypothetical protein
MIVAHDPVTAALLGASAELSGFEARFPQPDESIVDTIRRIRPRILLLEWDAARRREALAGPALMQGTRVALFAGADRLRQVAVAARRIGVACFTLPLAEGELDALLRRLEGDPTSH